MDMENKTPATKRIALIENKITTARRPEHMALVDAMGDPMVEWCIFL